MTNLSDDEIMNIYPRSNTRTIIKTQILSLKSIHYLLEMSRQDEGDYITLGEVLKYNKYTNTEICEYKDGILLAFA